MPVKSNDAQDRGREAKGMVNRSTNQVGDFGAFASPIGRENKATFPNSN